MTTIRDILEDTRSLDYSSYGDGFWQVPYAVLMLRTLRKKLCD